MTTRTCPVCGLLYCPDEEADRKVHKARHASFTAPLNPKPYKSLPREALVEAALPWLHKQMYLRARAFKREMRYDFIQWDDTGEDRRMARGFLFTDADGRIVGAVAFRVRYDDGQSGRWALQWAWFAPQYRRQGYLDRYWKQLRIMFGNFDIEPPVSDAMRAFARKHGDEHLIR